MELPKLPQNSNNRSSGMTGEVAALFVSTGRAPTEKDFLLLSINILCYFFTFEFYSFIGREVSRAVPFSQRHNYYPDLY